MAFTYSQDPTTSDVDAVRFEIQDTNAAAPLLQDAEVAWAILNETATPAGEPTTLTDGPLYASAARCCEVLARNLARQADVEVGSLKTTYSNAAKTFAERASELREKASGYAAPYAGGLSHSEKQSFRQDPDVVQPKFRRDEFGNPWAGPRDRDPGAFPPFGS